MLVIQELTFDDFFPDVLPLQHSRRRDCAKAFRCDYEIGEQLYHDLLREHTTPHESPGTGGTRQHRSGYAFSLRANCGTTPSGAVKADGGRRPRGRISLLEGSKAGLAPTPCRKRRRLKREQRRPISCEDLDAAFLEYSRLLDRQE
eukprot:scaffold1766_cov401-Prasinococcus_capsulatus_cf.AAC.28